MADGTPIHLVLMDDLQGKKLQAKQTVHFKVREDFVVDSKLIVKTGTEAIGHIESVSKVVSWENPEGLFCNSTLWSCFWRENSIAGRSGG